MVGVYCITNKINNKKYIGQSIYLELRLRQHKNKLNSGKHENQYLQNAWNKYGGGSFNFVALELYDNISKDKLDEIEAMYIYVTGSMNKDNGYNMKSGGAVSHMTDEVKQKISKANKGQIPYSKGKPMSEEQKIKISIANKGKKRSAETIAKLKNKPSPNKGKPMSEEQKLKISEARRGHTVSQETRMKISLSHKAKIDFDGGNK